MTTEDTGTELDRSLVQQIELLAPVPEPNLAAGRRRFVNAAQEMYASRAGSRGGRAFLPSRPRPLLVAFAALVLLAAVTMSVAAMMNEWMSPAAPRQIVTPALSPTFTATPTRLVDAALPSTPRAGASRSTVDHPKLMVAPRQVPTPQGTVERVRGRQLSILKWHLVHG